MGYGNNKILVFNNGYLGNCFSGGDRHLISIAHEWAKKNDIVFVLPRFIARRISENIETVGYPSPIPKSLLGILATYIYRIPIACLLALKIKADLVVCTSILYDLIPAFFHKLLFRSKVVTYAYHLIPRRNDRGKARSLQSAISYFAQRLALFFIRKSDIVFTCNAIVKSQLEEYGVDPRRIRTTLVAINISEIERANPIPKYQALFIGRLVAAKGLYDLIEAIKNFDITLGIVGEGEEMDNVKALIKKYGLESRVTLTGNIPDDKLLYSYLKGCDFFIFPSYEEGYGIVIAEAILAKKPVVAYELPHYKKAFGDGLITCPVGDLKMLTDNIGKLISGEIDENEILNKYEALEFNDAAGAAEADMANILNTVVEPL